MKATKHDQGKLDLSLIPKSALDAAAEAFMIGEAKYGRHNYKEGSLLASQIVAAGVRHFYQWFEGEERCPVDGQHHLGSVIACAAMLLELQKLGRLNDNRFGGFNENEEA